MAKIRGFIKPRGYSEGHRNSLLLNGAKNARNIFLLMSLTTLGRAFLSLSGMPALSSR
jgi:hypothetical protein